MVEWQPIETALKDGTWIIMGGERKVGMARWVEDTGEVLVSAPIPYWKTFDHSYWRWSYDLSDCFEPTHWMPLPPPPEVKE